MEQIRTLSSERNTEFRLTFWGVRGTLASPGIEFQRTGGNTICAELKCGDRIIVFDAGTGIRELGSKLIAQNRVRKLDLMFTHVHYDHVEGTPFFAPFFLPDFKVNVWMGQLDGAKSAEDAMKGLMRRPYFPVGPGIFTADITYCDVPDCAEFDLGDGIKLRTAPLNHPGGATAYRIDFQGRSFAFVTDTEHVPGKPNQDIIKLITDVDLFAYDTSLTDEELPDFVGYGHSTWEEALRLRETANAGAMLGVHHMPFRTDDEVDKMERHIKKVHPPSGMAREGMSVDLMNLPVRVKQQA